VSEKQPIIQPDSVDVDEHGNVTRVTYFNIEVKGTDGSDGHITATWWGSLTPPPEPLLDQLREMIGKPPKEKP
jgi:hypothetical protein